MGFTVTLADSEVADCRTEGDALVLRFSAAQVHEDGAPGARGRHGHAGGVVLRLAGVRLRERSDPLIGRLAAGRIGHAGVWAATLPLPTTRDGPLRLELAFANRSVLVADAAALVLAVDGDLRFAESLAC